MPLSTLRATPRDVTCKTEGQDGVAVSFLVGLFHSLQHAGLSRRTLINASAQSDARFREYVKAGRVLARVRLSRLNVAAQFAGGRGPYGNSMMGRSGVRVRHVRAPGCST